MEKKDYVKNSQKIFTQKIFTKSGVALHFSAGFMFVCKIPLLARRTRPKAARPSARATIGYLVYKIYVTNGSSKTIPSTLSVYNHFSILTPDQANKL